MADSKYQIKGQNSTGANFVINFTANNGTSDANAKTIAQSVATLFGTNVALIVYGSGVQLDYAGSTQGTTVTCPSGVQAI